MYHKIRVPEPCSEDWGRMSVEDQGRYCAVCCKTVIDFTQWEATAIIDYLQEKNKGRVCGRFNSTQLYQEEKTGINLESNLKEIRIANTSFIRKIAVAIMVSFGLLTTSCSDLLKEEADGDSINVKEKPVLKGNKAQLVDSLINEGHIVGIVVRPEGRMVLIAPPPPPIKTNISFKSPTVKGKVQVNVVKDSTTN